MRLADCHADRKHYAFGLCRSCWEKDRRRKAQKPRSKYRPIEHGTPQGYQRHRYRNEDACRPCLRAWRDDHRRRYLPHLKRDVATMATAIVDVLVTQDRWLTAELVADLVRDLHPEWKWISIKRRIHTLVVEGVIDSRHIGDRVEYRADDDAWELVA